MKNNRDITKAFDGMVDYWIGQLGVEPKLKFKIQHIPEVTDIDLSLSKIIDQIIPGPSVSSPLARTAIHKMLDRLDKPELKDRVITSTIPFRAR